MGILFGLAPWIIFWVLVGNVPVPAAALVALAMAVATFTVGRTSGTPGRTLAVGGLATFIVLTILALVLGQDVAARWIQPLSMVSVFLVALIGAQTGKPFGLEYAAAGLPPGVVESDLFQRIAKLVGWVWVGTFAGMTISSAVPPIVRADATIGDSATPLSYLCYWVIPFALLGLAVLAAQIVPDRMMAGMNDIVRKTTFVAFSEAEIDQLYYLAQEHANREVGAGQEAYDVRVGGSGTPLVGDESRMSWPSTYKVRERKR